MEWSEQQNAIFEWFEGGNPDRARSLVTRARAGTGKTTTIIEGINRAPERSIMLSAFNKSIAVELQQKLKNPYAEAKTLHAFGYSIIRRFWKKADVDTRRTNRIAEAIAGNQAPDEMVMMISKLAGKAKEMAPLATKPAELYELANEFECVPDSEWEADGWDVEEIARKALRVMASSKEQDGTVDYSDMLFLPIVQRWVRGRYDLVVIDEAQDMNVAQIILARKSVKAGGRLAVVGDDRQAIYGFRGADAGVLDRIAEETKAETLNLTTTYRCPKNVVALAQRIVPDYHAAESAPDGEVHTMGEKDAIDMAQPGDYLLSRKNAPLIGFCLKILRANKRARIQGKDIGKGLTALVNKWKVRSMTEILTRLTNWETREIARAEASDTKGADIRVERIKDQAEMLRAMSQGLSGLRELQARIDELFTDNGAPAVLCSSIHRIKGLEASRVFILKSTLRSDQDPPCQCGHWAHDKKCLKCGCVDYQPDEKKRLEETNLEYVAVTRSKNQLVWVLGDF